MAKYVIVKWGNMFLSNAICHDVKLSC